MAVMDVLHFLRTRAADAVAGGELVSAVARGRDRADTTARRSGGGGAQVSLPEAPSHLEFKRRVPDDRRSLYAPSADPAETVAAFKRVQRDLVGDPTLPLFTEGSRVMRARYPVAPFEEALRAKAMRRAGELVLRVQGDHAVATSSEPIPELPPVLLLREEGLWRVNLVETFKLFGWDLEGYFRLQTAATPYAQFFSEEDAWGDATLAPIDLQGEPIETAIARLEASNEPADRFFLAEVLMRNCFVSAEAMPLYQEAAEADPRYVVVFAQRASFMGMAEAALPLVLGRGPSHARWAAWLYERAGERELAREQYLRAVAWNSRDAYSREALARLARRRL
jgi:tetratricopeptide (TPR) repeat protein